MQCASRSTGMLAARVSSRPTSLTRCPCIGSTIQGKADLGGSLAESTCALPLS